MDEDTPSSQIDANNKTTVDNDLKTGICINSLQNDSEMNFNDDHQNGSQKLSNDCGSKQEKENSQYINVTYTANSFEVKPVTADSTTVEMSKINGIRSDDDDPDVRMKNGKSKKKESIGFFELFRFADNFDVLLMVLGSLGSMIVGAAIPMYLMMYSKVVDLLISHGTANITMLNLTNNNMSGADHLFGSVSGISINFCYVALAVLVGGYINIAFWSWTTERQTQRIRQLFFHSVMKQDIGWFDLNDSGKLNAHLTQDMQEIADGMGEKMGTFIQWISTAIGVSVMAIVQAKLVAVIALAFSPLTIFLGVIITRLARSYAMKESVAYAKAGSIAEAALIAIRTVTAFHGQEKESIRYSENLDEASHQSIKKGIFISMGNGFYWAFGFMSFAVSSWYGVVLIQEGELDPGKIFMSFIASMICAVSLAQAFSNIEPLTNSRGAALTIFKIIDQKPDINRNLNNGKIQNIQGNVELKNIMFGYPSRPDIQILKGLSLKFPMGKTVALVGSSGCGKSTVMQLIQRFYDPAEGQVLLDGEDIRDLNLTCLRKQMAVVSQEPVLFATTIGKNISYGQHGATQAQIRQAAKDANADGFISQLPQGYETMVGERGMQLSGGQKQRVAIARALIRNPKILLLDEATSALDNESEAIVQAALEKAGKGRTTIIIAHRLSTIRNADIIIAIQDGVQVEQGSHNELMSKEGLYYQLVTLQRQAVESGLDVNEIDILSVSEEDVTVDKLKRQLSNDSKRSLVVRQSTRRKGTAVNIEDSVKKNKTEETAPAGITKRVFQANAPEWPFICLGCLTSLVLGGINPVFAILFSEFIRIFALPDLEKQKYWAYLLGGIMIAIGIILCLLRLAQGYSFAKCGTELTKRLRQQSFQAMLRQDIGYFDNPKNQVGALTAKLLTDSVSIRGATGIKVGTTMEAVSILLVSLMVAFIFGWQLTLVLLAFLPIMIGTGYTQGRMLMGFAKGDKLFIEEAGKISMEALNNIRTIASLDKEDHFIQKYNGIFGLSYRKSLKKSHLYGLTFGFSQCVIYFAYAAAFSYGSYLVQVGEMEFYYVFRVLGAIVFGGMTVGRTSSYAPDLAKAKMAATSIFGLIDRKPAIDSSCPHGGNIKDLKGKIDFTDVIFRYPTRPDVTVLSKLSLHISPGETLALVGSSGCGKSTITQLLERFYDPEAGKVTLDQIDIKELNLKWLRSQIGIVSQEPVLFDYSIAKNIAYGYNEQQVPMDEIISAARKANIHNFIQSLPKGYETNVGDKGSQLSGGQKQRVAIARALVRNPKILILDEATSALDTESEQVVQEALDKARVGRTCIVIAHRLSTVQNADRIAVIDKGSVVEKGSHSQLLALNGIYSMLSKTLSSSNKNNRL